MPERGGSLEAEYRRPRSILLPIRLQVARSMHDDGKMWIDWRQSGRQYSKVGHGTARTQSAIASCGFLYYCPYKGRGVRGRQPSGDDPGA
jgi:hypothetical protein